MIRTVTYDTATHKIVPLEATRPMMKHLYNLIDEDVDTCKQAYRDVLAAAPEYQEPDIRAKLAVNMIKYLGATKSQAKAIIDGVFDGEHTIKESDLKYQEPTKDE